MRDDRLAPTESALPIPSTSGTSLALAGARFRQPATLARRSVSKKKGRRGAGILVGPQAGRMRAASGRPQKLLQAGTHLPDAVPMPPRLMHPPATAQAAVPLFYRCSSGAHSVPDDLRTAGNFPLFHGDCLCATFCMRRRIPVHDTGAPRMFSNAVIPTVARCRTCQPMARA